MNGFETIDKKFHFSPDWSQLGKINAHLPKFPDHYSVTDDRNEERPFRLVTAPARQFLNSSFTETPAARKREKRPTAKIHSIVCERLGIGDGDLIRIGNDLASVVLHVEVFSELQEDVVIVESIWPNSSFIEGVGINSLVSTDPGHGVGGAVFHDTSVWLKTVGANN